MATVDHENKTIHANLGDIDDMDAALTLLNALENEGYSVLAVNDQGYGFGFDNYGDMLGFLETMDPTSVDSGSGQRKPINALVALDIGAEPQSHVRFLSVPPVPLLPERTRHQIAVFLVNVG